jgi:hypothetical protein
MNGGEERCIHITGGKLGWKETTRKNLIKMGG